MICFTIIMYGIIFCSAQQTVSAAGGEAAGAGGTLSYTIGQVACADFNEIDGSVLQGVQQPREIYLINTIEERYGTNIEFSVCPNPAGSTLTLTGMNCLEGNYTYQLYDMNGKLLDNKKITGIETDIPMNGLAPSTYFLKITGTEREVKTFMIIKN